MRIQSFIIDGIEQKYDYDALENKPNSLIVPELPSENGEYVLKLTISGGNATYSWEVAE